MQHLELNRKMLSLSESYSDQYDITDNKEEVVSIAMKGRLVNAARFYYKLIKNNDGDITPAQAFGLVKMIREYYWGKPIHQHDCKDCECLGRFAEYDLWFHPAFGNDTFRATTILRYGIDGEYSSGLCFASGVYIAKTVSGRFALDVNHMANMMAKMECASRAVSLGLLPADWQFREGYH